MLSRNAICTLRGARSLSTRASTILSALDIPVAAAELPGVYDGQWSGSGDILESVCPATGEVLARVRSVSSRLAVHCYMSFCSAPNAFDVLKATPHELHVALEKSKEAFFHLRTIPAPKRGELLRQIREALSAKV